MAVVLNKSHKATFTSTYFGSIMQQKSKKIKSQHPQNNVQKTKPNPPWWTVLALGMTAPRGTIGKRHDPLDPDKRKLPLTATETIHTQYLLVHET